MGHALPDGYSELNVFSRIIVDEAMRRDISVVITDAATGEVELHFGGRTVHTVQSLSELTSAGAFARCDDKALTRRVVSAAGLAISPGRLATFDEADVAFLAEHGDLVVKPTKGEGGDGVSVGIVDRDGLSAALAVASAVHPEVLLERRHVGEDLRIVVIDGDVVAASVRRPPTVIGNGTHSVAELVDALNHHRGVDEEHHAHLALDDATLDTIRAAGLEPDSIPDEGAVVTLRRTANVHTGGSIHDVTDSLHSELAEVAVAAAAALDTPVLGLDLMVDAVDEPGYVVIEANEQPGLANHEPRPTAERFIDLLFPETRRGGPD